MNKAVTIPILNNNNGGGDVDDDQNNNNNNNSNTVYECLLKVPLKQI